MPARKTSSSIPPSGGEEDRRPGAAKDRPSEVDSAAGDPPCRIVQITPGIERRLKATGDLPDQEMLKTDDSPAAQQQKRQEEEQADKEERARALLEEELKALSYFEKGLVAFNRVHICRENRADVARALYLNPNTSALRVTMRRARKAYPCGRDPRACDGVPGCAHSRGKELWERIIQRVTSQLSAQ